MNKKEQLEYRKINEEVYKRIQYSLLNIPYEKRQQVNIEWSNNLKRSVKIHITLGKGYPKISILFGWSIKIEIYDKGKRTNYYYFHLNEMDPSFDRSNYIDTTSKFLRNLILLLTCPAMEGWQSIDGYIYDTIWLESFKYVGNSNCNFYQEHPKITRDVVFYSFSYKDLESIEYFNSLFTQKSFRRWLKVTK